MNKLTRLFFLSLLPLFAIAKPGNTDSISIKNLEFKFSQIDDQLKEVRRDELNYRIEKDLLKETYQNNYERISLFITLILGIIGVLGYLGLKDINSIKKEYLTELRNLKQLQSDMTLKFEDFQTSKLKYDTELRDILKTNEEQNKKIKVIELKDKIESIFKEERYGAALEFCLAALDLAPDDIPLLYKKAMVFTRLKNYKESITTYLRILEIDKNNPTAIYNLAEVYLFANEKKEHNDLLSNHSTIIAQKLDGKLLEIFSIITNYQDKDIVKLQKIALANIDISDLQTKKTRIEGWVFKDTLIYFTGLPASPEKIIAQNLIWYLDGQLTAEDFFKRTKIPKPSAS